MSEEVKPQNAAIVEMKAQIMANAAFALPHVMRRFDADAHGSRRRGPDQIFYIVTLSARLNNESAGYGSGKHAILYCGGGVLRRLVAMSPAKETRLEAIQALLRTTECMALDAFRGHVRFEGEVRRDPGDGAYSLALVNTSVGKVTTWTGENYTGGTRDL